jgi:hypothetical protein
LTNPALVSKCSFIFIFPVIRTFSIFAEPMTTAFCLMTCTNLLYPLPNRYLSLLSSFQPSSSGGARITSPPLPLHQPSHRIDTYISNGKIMYMEKRLPLKKRRMRSPPDFSINPIPHVLTLSMGYSWDVYFAIQWKCLGQRMI